MKKCSIRQRETQAYLVYDHWRFKSRNSGSVHWFKKKKSKFVKMICVENSDVERDK